MIVTLNYYIEGSDDLIHRTFDFSGEDASAIPGLLKGLMDKVVASGTGLSPCGMSALTDEVLATVGLVPAGIPVMHISNRDLEYEYLHKFGIEVCGCDSCYHNCDGYCCHYDTVVSCDDMYHNCTHHMGIPENGPITALYCLVANGTESGENSQWTEIIRFYIVDSQKFADQAAAVNALATVFDNVRTALANSKNIYKIADAC